MNLWKRLLPLALALALLAGCAPAVSVPNEDVYVDRTELHEVNIEDEAVALSAAPAALNDLLMPVASGTQVKENSRAVVDYSNAKDGYVILSGRMCTQAAPAAVVQGRCSIRISCAVSLRASLKRFYWSLRAH